MKETIEKQCSFSTLPKTMTIEISTNLIYFDNHCFRKATITTKTNMLVVDLFNN